MIPKFFGQYLLEKGVLTKDQLLDSIAYQKLNVRKLGEIAIVKGYMAQKQVDKVHMEQRRTDKFFGELSIEMGFLDKEKFDEILTIQQNSHIYLGEAIIACGYLDEAAVDAELKAFKKEQDLIPPVEVSFSDDMPEREAIEVMVDMTSKLFRRMGDILTKLGEPEWVENSIENLFLVSGIKFFGDLSCNYYISVPENLAIVIAKRIYKDENLQTDVEIIADTLNEFVNVVCGNIKAKLLEMGRKVDIQPPFYYVANDTNPVPVDGKTLVVPSFAPEGRIDIAITLT